MDANFLPMLVTCYPVPAATLLEWKPQISLAQDPVINKDSDVDNTDNDTPSPTLSAIPLPWFVVIDGESSAPAPKIPMPVTKAPTISSIKVMQDFFHSSFNFDNEENPWVPRA